MVKYLHLILMILLLYLFFRLIFVIGELGLIFNITNLKMGRFGKVYKN